MTLGAYFLWGMASHAFGAVQDVVADREAGISSIATAFGAARTVRFALVAYALAAWLLPQHALAVAIVLCIVASLCWPAKSPRPAR